VRGRERSFKAGKSREMVRESPELVRWRGMVWELRRSEYICRRISRGRRLRNGEV